MQISVKNNEQQELMDVDNFLQCLSYTPGFNTHICVAGDPDHP